MLLAKGASPITIAKFEIAIAITKNKHINMLRTSRATDYERVVTK